MPPHLTFSFLSLSPVPHGFLGIKSFIDGPDHYSISQEDAGSSGTATASPPGGRKEGGGWGGGALFKMDVFAGARRGYVFKRGPAGLGYYRDDPKPISLALAVGNYHVDVLQPVVLRLHGLVDCVIANGPTAPVHKLLPGPASSDSLLSRRSADIEAVEQQFANGHGCLGPAKKFGPKPRPARRSGPLSWWPGREEQKQLAVDQYNGSVGTGLLPHAMRHGLLAGCDFHIAVGLSAVDTANANAWSTFFDYCGRSAADLLVGQEVNAMGEDMRSSSEAALRPKGMTRQ